MIRVISFFLFDVGCERCGIVYPWGKYEPFRSLCTPVEQFESCGETEVDYMIRTSTTKSYGDGGRRLRLFCTFFFQLWRNKSELCLIVSAKQLCRLFFFSLLFDMAS